MAICGWCDKEHSNEAQSLFFRSLGEVHYTACSKECEDKIVDDIATRAFKAQSKPDTTPRTPIEIVNHYIRELEITKASPGVQQDPVRIAGLDAKIHLLETLKLDFECEYSEQDALLK